MTEDSNETEPTEMQQGQVPDSGSSEPSASEDAAGSPGDTALPLREAQQRDVAPDVEGVTYDGRISTECKDECQAGACQRSIGEPYGCGSCCTCQSACYVGWMEQRAEDNGYVKVNRCTCNAPLLGPGSGHESACGWEEA